MEKNVKWCLWGKTTSALAIYINPNLTYTTFTQELYLQVAKSR